MVFPRDRMVNQTHMVPVFWSLHSKEGYWQTKSINKYRESSHGVISTRKKTGC